MSMLPVAAAYIKLVLLSNELVTQKWLISIEPERLFWMNQLRNQEVLAGK
jgi:hypothetical protein